MPADVNDSLDREDCWGAQEEVMDEVLAPDHCHLLYINEDYERDRKRVSERDKGRGDGGGKEQPPDTGSELTLPFETSKLL